MFPNPRALLRLAGAVLVEIHDQWAVASDRRYLSENCMKLITDQPTTNPSNEEVVAKPAALTA